MSAKKTATGTEETKKEETAVLEKEATGGKTEDFGMQDAMVYVGPTVMGVATHNQVFNNGLPDGLKDAMEKEPAFKSLVVPVGSLAAVGNDIANKTGAAYVFYEKALNYKV